MPTIDIDPFTWVHGTKDIKGVVINVYQDHRDHGQLSQVTLNAEQATKLRDSITLLLESVVEDRDNDGLLKTCPLE